MVGAYNIRCTRRQHAEDCSGAPGPRQERLAEISWMRVRPLRFGLFPPMVRQGTIHRRVEARLTPPGIECPIEEGDVQA